MARNTGRREKDEGEKEDEEKTDRDQDDDDGQDQDVPEGLSSFMEGLPKGEETSLYIYRTTADGKRLYIAKVPANPPISPEFLKENYGGGDFQIFAYTRNESTGKFEICGRSRESIAGEPKVTAQAPAPVPAQSGLSTMQDAISMYRTIKELDGGNNQSADMIRVMGAVQTTMTSMNMMQMEMMKKFMDVMGGMSGEKKEPGLPSLISQGIDKVSNLVMGILISKNPAVAKIYDQPSRASGPADVEPTTIDGEATVEDTTDEDTTDEDRPEGKGMEKIVTDMIFKSLEKGQALKDPDYGYYYGIINDVPGLAKQLIAYPFEIVLPNMKANGLKVLDKPWLKGLYDFIKSRKGKSNGPETKNERKPKEKGTKNEGKDPSVP
jgi:hypothetical protein